MARKRESAASGARRCSVCGIEKPSSDYYLKKDGTPRATFCKSCWSDKYYKPRRAERIAYVAEWKRERHGRLGPREVVCGECGKTFTTSRDDTRFCSRSCKDQDRRRSQAQERLEEVL